MIAFNDLAGDIEFYEMFLGLSESNFNFFFNKVHLVLSLRQ